MAPAFTRSADFPITKPAGVPCVHLAGTVCSVHDRLRPLGFAGCVAYDCFGAGQVVSALPLTPERMHAALPVLRQVHELLAYLTEASARAPSPDLDAALTRVAALAASPDPASLDVATERARVASLLTTASTTIRTAAAGGAAARTGRGPRRGRRDRPRADPAGRDLSGRDLSGRDLSGRDLSGADLSGVDLACGTLRGAVVIGASLRGARLVGVDVLGADLRNADLSGADLTDALFLTRTQVGGALGSPATRLPAGFDRPPHWT